MLRRARLLPQSLILLGLVLAELIAPVPRTHAQQQQSALPDMRWVSPTWGFTVRWHSNEWSVAADESVDGADTLTLTDSLDNTVSFTGQRGVGGDADACLDEMVQSAQDTPGAVDFAIAQDEAGNPYEWRSPEQSYVVFLIRVPGEDGVLRDFVAYAECQTLVPGEAVFQRSYSGPPEVFAQWYDDIVTTLEGVYLPPSAWRPYFEDDPAYVSAGMAPLRGEDRDNASMLLDEADQPRMLIGLEAEAGATRVVSFTNLSPDPVTVVPGNISLLLTTLTGEVEDQSMPASAVRWEDGTAIAADGSRVLAPSEQAAALLDFADIDLTLVNCDMAPFLELIYNLRNGAYTEFAFSALPDSLSDCFSGDPPQPATGRPLFAPASTLQPATTVDVEREALILATPGQLDELGRIPLARLSFAPGAALPDDFLKGPLVAAVESGAIEVRLGETPVTLLGGQMISADEEAVLDVRNSSDDAPGTLLVLPLAAGSKWGNPLEENPPPGVDFDFLFPEQDLLRRSLPQQFAVERVVLPPGATLDVGDRAGAAPEYTALLIESGTVVMTDAEDTASEGTTLTAGAAERLPAGALLQAAAEQPAEFLLVDVIAAADERADQKVEAFLASR
jgi:hypothetical protein